MKPGSHLFASLVAKVQSGEYHFCSPEWMLAACELNPAQAKAVASTRAAVFNYAKARHDDDLRAIAGAGLFCGACGEHSPAPLTHKLANRVRKNGVRIVTLPMRLCRDCVKIRHACMGELWAPAEYEAALPTDNATLPF